MDPDADRLLGDDDKCPYHAEDSDGFEDDDGCPELDNDKELVGHTASGEPKELALRRAEAVAAHLRSLGVRPEQLVPGAVDPGSSRSGRFVLLWWLPEAR
jgi:hypothetical protein